MRDFSKISPDVWQSERFRALPSDEARYLFLYLMTTSEERQKWSFAQAFCGVLNPRRDSD